MRSVHSEDSGNAHIVSEDLLTISKDKVEDQAGLGLCDERKESIENRDRIRSLRSVCFEDSGYASGEEDLVSENLATIIEDWGDKQAKFDLLDRPKRNATTVTRQNLGHTKRNPPRSFGCRSGIML